jgi:two-component sensor histidine kinase
MARTHEQHKGRCTDSHTVKHTVKHKVTYAPYCTLSSCVLVFDQTQLVGIVTQGDIVRVLARSGSLQKTTLAEAMTRSVICCKQTESHDLLTLIQIMHRHQISHLPIVDEQDQVVGVVTAASALEALSQTVNVPPARLESLNQDPGHTVEDRTSQLEVLNQELRDTLHEKEVLLQEVHHRVKNNLQIISSLMSLQVRRLSHPDQKAAFDDCIGRVRTIALIHEQLYRSNNFAKINLGDYTSTVTTKLFSTFVRDAQLIELELSLDPVWVALEVALPCGLIVHELVSNALKHAFPNPRPGRIQVLLQQLQGGRIKLRVEDNGVGMPQPDSAKPLDSMKPQPQSLGRTLIQNLAQQLNAKPEYFYTCGTACEVLFYA